MEENKKRLAVIFGGCSEEYEVSLSSAYSVIGNLDKELYQVFMLGITRSGKWYLYQGDVENIKEDTWQDKACVDALISPDRELHGIMAFHPWGREIISLDAAFPVLHGKNGEDGSVQGLLEMAGIPIVGCGTLASTLCMDKVRAHKLAKAEGIAVPAGIVIKEPVNLESVFLSLNGMEYPFFVKPVRGGSSIGMTKVSRDYELPAAIKLAFEHDDQVLIEAGVAGFEVGCGVMGNEELQISGVDEIELFLDFFDYKEKYTQAYTKIHSPARIPQKLSEEIRSTAGRIYAALGCKGFARVDMFITPERKIVFNEVNTIPGLTVHSRYPNMVKGMGISYGEMLDKLIALAK